MTLSMYSASVPVLVRGLTNLSTFLDKGVASAEARKFDPAVLLSSRLAPDMHSLTRQVQMASDGAKGGAARLAGVDVPSIPDTETTFPELKARIQKTVDFQKAQKPEQFEGADERTVVLTLPGGDRPFPGDAFLLSFVLPNFLFHVTTAYTILRHNGVELGKRDFLGG